MNWIDMSDRDKLFSFAKKFRPLKFRIFISNDADSYYFDCADDGGINARAIMEYDIDSFLHLKDSLKTLWENEGCQEPELLATIVSATALKNKPKQEKEMATKEISGDSLDTPVAKAAHESVNLDDAPPVYVYEF